MLLDPPVRELLDELLLPQAATSIAPATTDAQSAPRFLNIALPLLNGACRRHLVNALGSAHT
jgi:hypothetical protein